MAETVKLPPPPPGVQWADEPPPPAGVQWADNNPLLPNAPEMPTAEPLKDLRIQAADMRDPKQPRQGVYLSAPNVEHLQNLNQLQSFTDGTEYLANFDDKGGMLLLSDKQKAEEAMQSKLRGVPMQEILGKYTMAGQGKPAVGVVVAQQTPDGATARESYVRPEDAQKVAANMEQPGRTVTVDGPASGIVRRMEGVAQDLDPLMTAPPGVTWLPDDPETTVKIARAQQLKQEAQADKDPTAMQMAVNNVMLLVPDSLESFFEVAPQVMSGAVDTVGSIVKAAPATLMKLMQSPYAMGIEGPLLPEETKKQLSAVNTHSEVLEDAVNAATKELTIPYDEQKPWVTQDIPRALGSGGVYLLGGMLGGTPTIAGLGSLGTGQALYEDALAKGGTEEQARLAETAGSILGLSEALPFEFFLGKLNKATGGKLGQTILKLPLGSDPKLLTDLVQGFLVEATQEGLSTVGENFIASDLAQYDPDRTLGENFWKNFVTGGAVGSMFAGGLGVMQRRRISSDRQQKEEEYQQKLETNDPINDIVGSFEPIDKMKKQQELEGAQKANWEALQQAGEDAIQNQDFLGADPGFVEPNAQGLNNTGSSEEFFQQISTIGDQAALKTGGKTVKEALVDQQVVVTQSTMYDLLAQAKRRDIKKLEMEIEVSKRSNEAGAMLATTKLELRLKEQQGDLKKIARRAQAARGILQRIGEYTKAWAEVFGADFKYVVTEVNPHHMREAVKQVGTGQRPTTRGSMAFTKEVPLTMEKLGDVFVVSVNPDNLVQEIMVNRGRKKSSLDSATAKADLRSIFLTMNHELGHTVAASHLANVVKKAAEQGDMEAGRVYSAILSNYRNWVHKAQTGNSDLLKADVAPFRPQGQQELGIPNRKLANRNYLFSFDEWFAEMTARIAHQGKLEDPIMTKFFQPVLEQFKTIFKRLPAFAQNEYGGNVERWLMDFSLKAQLKNEIERVAKEKPKDLLAAMKGKVPGMDGANFVGWREDLDKWNWIRKVGFNLLQVARDNQHIVGLKQFVSTMHTWSSFVRNQEARAVETVKAWRKLGKEQANAVTNLLLEESELGKTLPLEVIGKRLSAEGYLTYQRVRADLRHILELMEVEAERQLRRDVTMNETQLNESLDEMKKEFERMRTKGYFPYMRFGKWTLQIRATADAKIQGVQYKEGQVVSFESFDTERERNAQSAHVRAMLRAEPVSFGESTQRDEDFTIQGMPSAIIRALRKSIPNMSLEQERAFEKALEKANPMQGFRKHLMRKRGVEGYSKDALRSYAAYMKMAAGHLARVKYYEDLRGSVESVHTDAALIRNTGGNSDKRQQIANWMQETLNYAMTPANEWQALRSLAFTWFMGFNIKSAALNATQVPMVAFPFLGAKYGDVKAGVELNKAMSLATSYWMRPKSWIDSADGTMKARLGEMIQRGLHEGWIDQALATELAIASSEGNVDRGFLKGGGKDALYKVGQYGALPFQLVEKMNRVVTAMAAYNLHYDQTKEHSKSILAARDAIEQTMYEYSRWNKPAFMRGKVGSAFMFMNYMQNTLYFATRGDKAAMRFWVMSLLASGLMGLPGAEDFEDLFDGLGSWINKFLGVKNPKVQLKVELRHMVEEIGGNPDIILHGLGQQSFGMAFLGNMAGLPVPSFDLSGSLGMGDVVPGTGLVRKMGNGYDLNDALVEGLTDFGGAAAGGMKDILGGVYSTDPNTWRRAEKFMPAAAKAVSKAARISQEGRVETTRGDVVAEFDPFDARANMEVFGQGLGFTPSRVSKGWEREQMGREVVTFYKAWSEELMRQFNYAIDSKDREAIADSRKAIKHYNDVVPFGEMRINGESLLASRKSKARQAAMIENDLEPQRKFSRLRQSAEEAYTNPDASGSEGTAAK